MNIEKKILTKTCLPDNYCMIYFILETFFLIGGSGRRKLTSVLQGPEGYTFDTLKGASCSGKNTLFLVPLQEQLSVQPLPYDSPEFAKMPKANCMKCGILMPFQLLSLHVEECNVSYVAFLQFLLIFFFVF